MTISKLTEIPRYEVFVRYKIGHFGYYLIDDFQYDKILGTPCIYLDLFDQANCFKCILIYGLSRIERKEVETSELDVDTQ